MIDLIKKTMLTGIGAAILTKEKIEELAQELVDRGKLSEQEGEKIVREMIDKTEESKKDLQNQIDQLIEAALARMQLVRASDIENLQGEINSLRKEIEELRGAE